MSTNKSLPLERESQPPEVALVVVDTQHEFCFPDGPVTPNKDEDILRIRRFIHQYMVDHTKEVTPDSDWEFFLDWYSVLNNNPD